MLAELSPQLMTEIHRAAAFLSTAKRVCILTGAGVSAESGVPTFRDEQTGFWAQYSAEDLASPEGFLREPEVVWAWYQWRRELMEDKKPNLAHQALAQWQQHIELSQSNAPLSQPTQQLTLITQNVDDLHEQAGSSVTHLHGYLNRNRCSQCNTPYTLPVTPAEDKACFGVELLHCEQCSGYIRPDIVWFGESLPTTEWQLAELAAKECEVFISIGTSSMVYPAAGLAQLAQQNGAKIIEVNPNPSPQSHAIVDVILEEKAGIVLPILIPYLMTSS